MEVTGIILAGGKSLRLGRDKSAELVGGIPVIERVIRRLTPITSRLLIVTSRGKNNFSDIEAVKIITDIYPSKGPISGIYSGLCASRTVSNIVVSCGMPFLNTELLEHMAKLLPSYDAIVPRWPNGRKEPFHAVYSISCLPTMKKHLENNRFSIIQALSEMHVLHLNKIAFSKFDPEFFSFFKINDQVDVDLANKIAATEQPGSKTGR